MTHLDDKIRQALDHEDAELLQQSQTDVPLYEQLIGLYRGRLRWLNVGATFGTLVLFALLFVIAYQFFHAGDVQEMIAWATAFVTCFVWLALMKIWFWQEMHKNAVTREIKRLELQMANLSQKLDDKTT